MCKIQIEYTVFIFNRTKDSLATGIGDQHIDDGHLFQIESCNILSFNLVVQVFDCCGLASFVSYEQDRWTYFNGNIAKKLSVAHGKNLKKPTDFFVKLAEFIPVDVPGCKKRLRIILVVCEIKLGFQRVNRGAATYSRRSSKSIVSKSRIN